MWPFRKKTKKEYLQKQWQQTTNNSHKQFELIPPEGVPLHLPLATLGERLGAQVVDYCTTLFASLLLILLLAFALQDSFNATMTIFWLLFFLMRIPYYIITELIWNGKTLAKRWMGLQVISSNGRSLTPHQVVSRNLMKEIEFFTPLSILFSGIDSGAWKYAAAIIWIIILYITLSRSKKNQRIGDMIAATVVIKDLKPVLLKDISQSSNLYASKNGENRFIFTSQHMEYYGKLELVTLENLLRNYEASIAVNKDTQAQLLSDVVKKIIKKIQYPEAVSRKEHYIFLKNFYQAQRAHLENRQLFGDVREHKFYKSEAKNLKA